MRLIVTVPDPEYINIDDETVCYQQDAVRVKRIKDVLENIYRDGTVTVEIDDRP
jgi:hypothetical protein